MTATDTTVTGLTVTTENVGHNLYTDNSSPELFDDLCTEKIICCGNVTPNRRAIPNSITQK
jgi:hypothetical protein